jgi:hypothetical protein
VTAANGKPVATHRSDPNHAAADQRAFLQRSCAIAVSRGAPKYPSLYLSKAFHARVMPSALVLRRNKPREQETMEERRKYPRTEINEPAYVSSGGSVMTCVVRNISPEGAAIDVENPAFVPERFRLVMAKDSSVHECAVAWIRKNRIGLTFVAAPNPKRK